MRNYRIAYFTADWNYELVETTLHGLRQFVDDHEHVQLCVFDCFGKDTRLLHPAHCHHGQEVSHMQTVTGGVESHIETHFFFLQQIFQGIFRGTLVNESAFFQIVKGIDMSHGSFSIG